ncbi:MAG: SRPBCC domain-containing protein [Steroidobacteraceae bacterium]
MAPKTRGFAHRIDIAAQPPQVWTVLCGPRLIPLWLGADAHIKPQQGGRWMATVAPGLEREAMIDVFDPPRRLRLIYLPPADLPEFEGALVDDILLDGEGDGTIVRLLCSGVPDSAYWNTYITKIRASTERALSRLKAVVEKRESMAALARSAT